VNAAQITHGVKRSPAENGRSRFRTCRFARDLLLLLLSPRVAVTLSGGDGAAETYRYYTARHPRFFLIQNKRWGAALLRLPATFEDYLKDPSRHTLRRKRQRCLSLGYSFAAVDPNAYFEAIFRINTSKPRRQGEEMHREYVDRGLLREFFSVERNTYGVFDSAGVLRAYACAPVYGELFNLIRLLGEGNHLNDGIMYLLMSEFVREMIRARSETGVPLWGMYDMYFGAQPGLRKFKDRLGFAPHNVKWRWEAS
jgi:hypothetical protein